MLTSVTWINDYLEPHASAEEQAALLTSAGFPMEASQVVDGQTQQDIELTSNRGDCLCHVGLAREIAAVSGRAHKLPRTTLRGSGPPSSTLIKVTNEQHGLCPLYTARVIRAVKVGPSPDWLASRLRTIGQIPRNNIVDASNFVLFELGQPTHVFDLAKLAGPEIVVRMAAPEEPLLPIGEGALPVRLTSHDLVIADAAAAVAIAGVKGGGPTAVTAGTRDIVIEAAAFDPVTVRQTSRRHGIASDSSYRFERGVHPGQVVAASDRLVDLILQLAGGELCEGVISAGAPIPPLREILVRPDRCRKVLGVPVSNEQMLAWLSRLGFDARMRGHEILCTVPAERLDIEREIDLIEEVARMHGLDQIPTRETIEVRVAPAQPAQQARRAVNDALVGMGFVETVTHSLISETAAAAFLPPGMHALRVADERARSEPVLRPSILPSLLRVLALNRDNGVQDVKLFETASTFARLGEAHAERVNLALLQPAASLDLGLREIRGAIDRIIEIVLGPRTPVEVDAESRLAWLSPGAVIRARGEVLGTFGLIAPQTAGMFGLLEPVLAAEIGLPQYYPQYPPEREVSPLPAFPAIERDISAILEERIMWTDVRSVLESLGLAHLEAIEFVTTFRGKSVPAGRKSMTLRLRFRAGDRTLTHEEVDVEASAAMDALRGQLQAEIRT
jgi:phenylalanyl-tRNA synthetase beta chain